MNYADILAIAKLENPNDGNLAVLTPIDGSQIARVQTHSPAGAEKMIALGQSAFEQWRLLPAPRRGELIRLFGEELRAAKEP